MPSKPRPGLTLLALAAAVALSACQSIPEPQPLPQVATGDAGPMPRKGRPWRWDERKAYGLEGKFWRFTDEHQDSFYNCLGFAMSSEIFGMRELPGERDWTVEKADRFFTELGWTVSADCKPKKGVRKVVTYCQPGGNGMVDPDDLAVHFAKQYRDDWWEGKMGCSIVGNPQPPRILYPGVGSISYGNGRPCRCYEMPLARLIEYIKARVLPAIAQARQNAGGADPVADRAEKEANERIRELEEALKDEGTP